MKLAHCEGLAAPEARALLSEFGLPEQIFHSRRAQLERVVNRAAASAVLAPETPQLVERLDHAVAWSQLAGNHIIALDDARYPIHLLDVSDPPLVLYVRGDPTALSAPALCVSGSERATAEGCTFTRALCENLAAQGWTILAGLADGTERAAHEGTLAGGGRPIAVAATGVDRVFPARQLPLARQIAAAGALVSELPLGTEARSAALGLPQLHRLMVGLARAILVVEARINGPAVALARSGSEQGRDVFATPGSINAPLSKGPHSLIKQGAKLVESAEDIVSEFAARRRT